MAARGSRGTSSLLKPLNVVDVLIPDEVVQYNERKHWASLIQPFLETIAILIFITMFAGGLPTGAFGGFLAIGAAIVIFIMYRQRKWKGLSVFLVLVGLLLGFVILGGESFAVALILASAARFIYKSAMWAFYERLYITNRRVIAASGFLGAQINGMPLTRITDIAFERTVPGEILDYGTLRIETAGQDQALGLITFLNEPDLFYNILIHLSTTALGAVKEPMSRESMEAARAHTVKPSGSNRPVRLSFRRRPRNRPRRSTGYRTGPPAPGEDFDDGT